MSKQRRNTDIGRQGEALAADYLEAKGYRIAARNYRAGRCEIDLIAWTPAGDILVFVEVKARKSADWGSPESFIDADKIERLSRAAGVYMESISYEWEIRFDVIAILGSGPDAEIRHLEDVFF